MVKWTIPAKLDLKNIYNFIAKDSKFYAKKVVQDIVEKSDNLIHFPKIGRTVPEIGDSSVRELILYSYRLIYEITKSDIQILALIHVRRNFSSNILTKNKKP